MNRQLQIKKIVKVNRIPLVNDIYINDDKNFDNENQNLNLLKSKIQKFEKLKLHLIENASEYFFYTKYVEDRIKEWREYIAGLTDIN